MDEALLAALSPTDREWLASMGWVDPARHQMRSGPGLPWACSCGWVGRKVHDSPAAEVEEAEHWRAVGVWSS